MTTMKLHIITPQGGGHEYEIVDEIRRGNTTRKMDREEREDRPKKADNLDSTQSQDEA